MENQEKYKKNIQDSENKLMSIEQDLDSLGYRLSEESKNLLVSGVRRYRQEIQEANLSLRYLDYQ